jgi:hypothetical protein
VRARIVLAAVLAASVLLHVLLLGWLAGGAGLPGERVSGGTVDVSLIGGDAVAALQGVSPRAPAPVAPTPVPPASTLKPTSPPKPRPAPTAVPRPNAISSASEPSASTERALALAARMAAEAARADPLAQSGEPAAQSSGDAAERGEHAATHDDEERAAGDGAPSVGAPGGTALGHPGSGTGTPAAIGTAAGSTAAGSTAAGSASAAETAAGPARGGAAEADAGEPGAAGAAPGLLFGGRLPAPAPGQWKFRVFYGDYADGRSVASLDYSIEMDGTRYRLRTEGRAEGLTALLYSGVLTQSSAGQVGDNGLMPEHYSEQRGKRAERHATIDRTRNEVRFSDGNARASPVPGMQDRLSALVQLGLIARAAPERFAAGASIDMPELSMKGVIATRYRSLGAKVLETPDGVLQTIHLERVLPRNQNDPRIEIWLGRDHQFLPVRVRLTDENGRVLDQLFTR